MILAHQIALDPNNDQETYFRKAAGIACHWALDQWQQPYEAWKADPTLLKPSDAVLRRPLNAVKRDAFPGMLEVTKNALVAMMHLRQAFQNFFAGTAAYPEAGMGAHAPAVAIRWPCARGHPFAPGCALVSLCDRRDARSAKYPSRTSWVQSKENPAVVGEGHALDR